MDIKLTKQEQAGVVLLNGDIDFYSYKELETVLENSLMQGDAPIILDLTGVPHIDSMGLGAITKFWRQASEKDVAVYISGARKNVRSMIKLVNLDGRIKMFDSVSDALS